MFMSLASRTEVLDFVPFTARSSCGNLIAGSRESGVPKPGLYKLLKSKFIRKGSPSILLNISHVHNILPYHRTHP